MSGDYLLDTNIIVDIFRKNQVIINKIKDKKIKTIYVPVIVIGELYFGANKSDQIEKRTLEVEQLERTVVILNINKVTARIYGRIKNELRAKGNLIPENDIWIAAVAKENNLPILTKDKHFQHITDIIVEQL